MIDPALVNFVSTVGFPIALSIGILFVIYKLVKKISCTAGESARKWFDSQTNLAETLKISIEQQITIMQGIENYATHGHKAFHYALKSMEGLVKEEGERDRVDINIEKAKEALLYNGNEND